MEGRLRAEEGKEGRKALLAAVDTLLLAETAPQTRLCRDASWVTFTCPLGIPSLSAHMLALYMGEVSHQHHHTNVTLHLSLGFPQGLMRHSSPLQAGFGS